MNPLQYGVGALLSAIGIQMRYKWQRFLLSPNAVHAGGREIIDECNRTVAERRWLDPSKIAAITKGHLSELKYFRRGLIDCMERKFGDRVRLSRISTIVNDARIPLEIARNQLLVADGHGRVKAAIYFGRRFPVTNVSATLMKKSKLVRWLELDAVFVTRGSHAATAVQLLEYKNWKNMRSSSRYRSDPQQTLAGKCDRIVDELQHLSRNIRVSGHLFMQPDVGANDFTAILNAIPSDDNCSADFRDFNRICQYVEKLPTLHTLLLQRANDDQQVRLIRGSIRGFILPMHNLELQKWYPWCTANDEHHFHLWNIVDPRLRYPTGFGQNASSHQLHPMEPGIADDGRRSAINVMHLLPKSTKWVYVQLPSGHENIMDGIFLESFIIERPRLYVADLLDSVSVRGTLVVARISAGSGKKSGKTFDIPLLLPPGSVLHLQLPYKTADTVSPTNSGPDSTIFIPLESISGGVLL